MYAPVAELMTPPPEKIVNVFGATPPVVANVKLPFTDNVIDVGEIAKAELTVTVDVAVAANASVTRTVTVPADAGAVNNPVVEFIVPPPDTIEYVSGGVPPLPKNVCVSFTTNVTEAGLKLKTEVTVSTDEDVLPIESVTKTVATVFDAGAVYKPVDGSTEPAPAETENKYGDTPPVADKLNVALVMIVCEIGEICKAAFTVTFAVTVAPKESDS